MNEHQLSQSEQDHWLAVVGKQDQVNINTNSANITLIKFDQSRLSEWSRWSENIWFTWSKQSIHKILSQIID